MESGFPGLLPHWTFGFTDETLRGVLPQMNVDYMPLGPCHNTLLSSMTVFRDSIHIGSISPSSKIHLGPSWEMLASSLMMEEKSPVRNHRWLLFSSTDPGSLHTASQHWQPDRADSAFHLALPGTWHLRLGHILSGDQTNSRTSGGSKQCISSWQFRFLSDNGPGQSSWQVTASQENYPPRFARWSFCTL